MIKSRISFLIFPAIALLAGCSFFSGKKEARSVNEQMVLATLYQQTAAEYDALCYQAFNMAEIMIRDAKSRELGGELAIITDIDETVLDNSPYQAACILNNYSYPTKWDEWCLKVEAKAVPGSQQFFNFVAAQGIQVFYITNRKEHLKECTLENLIRRGFPMADEAHLLMREKDNSKEIRRRLVEGRYRVVLLLGDNLDDFTNAFEEKTPGDRQQVAQKLKSSFGRRFIMFPNAMYGSWETSLYDQKDTLGLETEKETRYHFLTPFPSSGQK
jgi:5'-nucleotidase (lipoprotein e(P4) family)